MLTYNWSNNSSNITIDKAMKNDWDKINRILREKMTGNDMGGYGWILSGLGPYATYNAEATLQPFNPNQRDRLRSRLVRWGQWGILPEIDQTYHIDDCLVAAVLLKDGASARDRKRATQIAGSARQLCAAHPTVTRTDALDVREGISVTWYDPRDGNKTAILALTA